jgi:serine protease Do
VVATDPGTGLALLKMESNNLPFVQLGKPGSVKVGATVHTIGSGAGLDFSSATGSVVSLDAPIGALHQTHFIRIDISLSPDCAGNPLFDQRGNLVGINASIGKAAEDCSFAIPIDLAHDLLEKYFSTEKSDNEVTSKSEAVLNTK